MIERCLVRASKQGSLSGVLFGCRNKIYVWKEWGYWPVDVSRHAEIGDFDNPAGALGGK